MSTPTRGEKSRPPNGVIPNGPQGQDNQDNQDNALPGYSESLIAIDSPIPTQNQQLLTTPGLPNVNILAYLPPNATLSSDHTTITVRDHRLSQTPDALASFIMAQAALPPRPIVRVKGSVVGDTKFDLKIDMMRYLVRKGDEPAWNYIKIADKDEITFRGESSTSAKPHYSTVLEWAQKYVNSPAGNKSFLLKREIPNWDTQLLEGRIRVLLASLKDNNNIQEIENLTISFLATHTHVVVQPPQSNVFHQIISTFSPIKKFAVVKAIWPYANTATGRPGGLPRQCAVQSEDDWWQVWRRVIAMGVLSKRRGWLGTEDVIDMAMCSRSRS